MKGVDVRASIGLPVRNGERYLGEALASILAQSVGDFELIVSDNASQDGTEEICRDFARRDGRIRYLRQPRDGGAAANYNRVLAEAQAPSFKWAAHDDLLAPEFLEACLEQLKTAPAQVVLVHPRALEIGERGEPLGASPARLDLRQPRPSERFRALLASPHASDPLYGLFRTALLRRTRGHGAYFGGDEVLRTELALLGPIWELPEPLLCRRRHPGALSERLPEMSPAEVAAWFDPVRRSPLHFLPRTRFRVERLRAIARAPISRREKRRCYRHYAAAVSRRRLPLSSPSCA